MPRPPGSPKTPGSGRKRGTPNKRQVLSREIARAFVDDPVYREMLRQRLRDGTLSSAVETMLWAYAFGRPTGASGENGDTVPATITIHF